MEKLHGKDLSNLLNEIDIVRLNTGNALIEAIEMVHREEDYLWNEMKNGDDPSRESIDNLHKRLSEELQKEVDEIKFYSVIEDVDSLDPLTLGILESAKMTRILLELSDF